MSKIANLLLLAVAVSLIFVSGCKDKPIPEPDPVEVAPVKSQPDDSVAGKVPIEPEDPVKPVDPVKPADPVEPADPVKPVTVAPVEEKKIETPTVAVVPAVINEAVLEEGGGDIWMTDYRAAMKKAAAEKKDMLIDFSGSDWCGWCIRLDNEVFSQREFIEAASKDFVFVMLDFPQDKSRTTPQLQQQNSELKKTYFVSGFPTVFLTDAQGMPYAKTGYQQGGPKGYLAYLAELKKTNVQVTAIMAKVDSDQLDDLEKAKLLDEAVSLMSPELVANFYSDRIDRIIALDSENKAGLRDNHLAKRAIKDVADQARDRNFDKVIELVDKIIKDLKISGQIAQEAYYYRAMAFDFKGEKDVALENLNKSIAADPESPMAENIREVIKNVFSKPEPEPTIEETSE